MQSGHSRHGCCEVKHSSSFPIRDRNVLIWQHFQPLTRYERPDHQMPRPVIPIVTSTTDGLRNSVCDSSLTRQTNGAIPVGRRSAIMQDYLLHQKVLRAVAGWHPVQTAVRLVPASRDEMIDALLVLRN